MADHENDFGAFLAGLLLGGLVGAGVALFLAPQSGEETREMIRERGIELKSRAEEAAGGLRTRAEGAIREGRQGVEDAASGLRTRAEGAIREGRRGVEDAVEAARHPNARRKPGAAEGEAPD